MAAAAEKQKLLIVDDSEMNRSILADMLGDEYEIIEAENGVQAVTVIQKYGTEISLVLLDIVMPEMDGFEVLSVMNQRRWIEDIPVIMISAERRSSRVEQAYALGVTDFISRPFDAVIVHRRVVNTILLYAKQKKLVGLVEEQIYEKERQSNVMIDILSHIVESRNGESGLHVLHIHTLTELMLEHLVRMTDKYVLSRSEIALISTASALHDIGKMAIPEEILNKPGRLTDEEFAIMKTHTIHGAAMIQDSPVHQDDPLVRMVYCICRWHHERYDGRGYPDGLKGDEIPICAQIVALADVYDALTSERVYKKAFSHEKAVEMILNGECGVFNPLLMSCLKEMAGTIQEELRQTGAVRMQKQEMRHVVGEMLNHDELSASERTLMLLEHERMKYSFFASLSKEIQFEYTVSPPMVTLSAWSADQLELPEVVMDPMHDKRVLSRIEADDVSELTDVLHRATIENPRVEYDCQLLLGGEKRWMNIICQVIWSGDELQQYTGIIGKAVDISEMRVKMDTLQQMAQHDGLTGLFNRTYAKQWVKDSLKRRMESQFAMAILDLDFFKHANDHYGHLFGDRVLMYVADQLRHSIRSGDIAARIGGDEFLIFLEYSAQGADIRAIIQRIYNSIKGTYEEFPVSISMGIATTECAGSSYKELFSAADKALYAAKEAGRGRYCFYDDIREKEEEQS